MHKFLSFCLAFFFCLLTSAGQSAAVALSQRFEVARTISDHAVLQRDRPIVIHGTGEPGKAVYVQIGSRHGTGIANADGRWEARMESLPAGGPYTLTVKGAPGTSALVFRDIMIGEVWICSGQSNMEMPVYSKGPGWRDERYADVLKMAGEFPQLRLFNASRSKYMSPCQLQSDPIGKWQLASEESVASFSATAFHFGMNLCKMLPGVPVGLIHASWSGTRIEPWISWQGYEGSNFEKEKADVAFAKLDIKYREALKKKSREKYRQQTEAWIAAFEANTDYPEAKNEWADADFDDSSWENLPRAPRDLFPENMDGVIWMRHTAAIPKEWIGHELQLFLGAIDDCDWTYVNGELVGETLIDTATYWYVPREYRIPAEIVTTDRVTIAVRVADLYEAGGFNLNGENMKLTCKAYPDQSIDVGKKWRCRKEFSVDMKTLGGQPKLAVPSDGTGDMHFPSTLYNSMIHPWTNYPVRGAIWYQGCSNISSPETYQALQELLIDDWRNAWQTPAMAFIITQLSGYKSHFEKIREAQRLAALNRENVGLAVTIDIGNENDIHPQNKTDVGYRLACEAERICYGRKSVSAGPMCTSAVTVGDKVTVTFSNVGSGLRARGNNNNRLNYFELAGDDGRFFPATAEIQGDKVIVYAPGVRSPRAVRYAWMPFAAKINFYNAEGFPASPFWQECGR